MYTGLGPPSLLSQHPLPLPGAPFRAASYPRAYCLQAAARRWHGQQVVQAQAQKPRGFQTLRMDAPQAWPASQARGTPLACTFTASVSRAAEVRARFALPNDAQASWRAAEDCHPRAAAAELSGLLVTPTAMFCTCTHDVSRVKPCSESGPAWEILSAVTTIIHHKPCHVK